MRYYFGKGKYDKEYGDLWDKYVPKSGQANTVQGELVRAIGRLASEAYRNGNINWDAGFRILVTFLQKHLADPAVFDRKTVAQIKNDLSAIGNMGNGSSPMDFADYDSAKRDDVYDRITDRVVEWCVDHPKAIRLPKNPKLKR